MRQTGSLQCHTIVMRIVVYLLVSSKIEFVSTVSSTAPAAVGTASPPNVDTTTDGITSTPNAPEHSTETTTWELTISSTGAVEASTTIPASTDTSPATTTTSVETTESSPEQSTIPTTEAASTLGSTSSASSQGPTFISSSTETSLETTAVVSTDTISQSGLETSNPTFPGSSDPDTVSQPDTPTTDESTGPPMLSTALSSGSDGDTDTTVSEPSPTENDATNVASTLPDDISTEQTSGSLSTYSWHTGSDINGTTLDNPSNDTVVSTQEPDTTPPPPGDDGGSSVSTEVIVLSTLLGVFVLLSILLAIYIVWKLCCNRRKPGGAWNNDAEDATFTFTGQALNKRQSEVLEMAKPSVVYIRLKDSVPKLNENNIHVLTGVKLSDGRFGPVYKGFLGSSVASMVEVVCKTIKDNFNEEEMAGFVGHVEAYSTIEPHLNVVRLYGVLVTSPHAPAAFEFCMYGTLWAVLRQMKNRDERFRDIDNRLGLLEIALGVASGMRHLSSRGTVHRELSALHVMIASSFVPKISGLYVGKPSTSYRRWSAPEVLSNRTHTFMSDVWSFGVLLWEIFSLGEKPYSEIASGDLFYQLTAGHRLSRPGRCEDSMFELMNRCWAANPYDRPTFLVAVERIKDAIRTNPGQSTTSVNKIGVRPLTSTNLRQANTRRS